MTTGTNPYHPSHIMTRAWPINRISWLIHWTETVNYIPPCKLVQRTRLTPWHVEMLVCLNKILSVISGSDTTSQMVEKVRYREFPLAMEPNHDYEASLSSCHWVIVIVMDLTNLFHSGIDIAMCWNCGCYVLKFWLLCVEILVAMQTSTPTKPNHNVVSATSCWPHGE